LIVEDDDTWRDTLTTFLELNGYQVDGAGGTREANDRLRAERYSIVISDIYIDDKTGIEILQTARKENPDCAVILMSGRGSMETVSAGFSGGAVEYLAKPFELGDLLAAVKRSEAQINPPEGDDTTDIDDLPETEMVGSSQKMVEIYKTIAKVGPTDATVLIEGETGSGKELIARMVHKQSRRAPHPFVAVDCGAIAPSLLESELFGTLKGAYTGADRDRAGVFEAAHNGTVFLDEIGDIEHGFQLKLLRFLQEREIRPLGSAKAKLINVRVVAATNKDIPKMVEEGKFREDLWFRLNVVRIQIPPLCERQGDIRLLAHHFLKKYNGRYHSEARLTESGERALNDYSWPGNVRQLEHMIERMSILAPSGRIDGAAVKDAISQMDSRDAGGDTLADTEAEQIRRVMAATGGNKSRAAKILGIERKTLYRKLERMGL
jgi:DNA-binding NtrC family response regulator